MPAYRRLTDLQFRGQRVLLRAGFDVPIENGRVVDRTRIEAMLPTMETILKAGASLVIMAHQDRPKGKVVKDMSQKPLLPVLEELLGKKIAFADDCLGKDTQSKAAALKPGEVLLLENLRFHIEEEENDPTFAKSLASLGGFYVDDAFSNAHRSHASMVGVPTLLPSAMGLQMEKEVAMLSKAREGTHLCVIVSGKKLETKVPVIEEFLSKADSIVIGGAIANTFLAASGKIVGTSLIDEDEIPLAKEILGRDKGKIILPIDAVVAEGPGDGANAKVLGVDALTPDSAILDVGPATLERIEDALERAKTIVWNGPLGYAEEKTFATGSVELASLIAAATSKGAFSVMGGGDTLELHERMKLPLGAYSFVSTGGGAMLDFLAGKELPALSVLRTA